MAQQESCTINYQDMVDDVIRTEAYAQALRDVVNPGDVVVDIGTGSFAILARQAAMAGAGRVFAIEVDPAAASAARQCLDGSSYECCSKIEVMTGASAEVALPIKADVVVHELIGLIAGSEGAAAILRDAFTRHAKQLPPNPTQPWTVPAQVRSWLVPVELPTKQDLLMAGSVDGHLKDPFPKDLSVSAISNFPFTQCAIAHPNYFEVLDFARMPLDPKALTGSHTRKLIFVCHRPGDFAGFGIFITGEMTPQAVATAAVAEIQKPGRRKGGGRWQATAENQHPAKQEYTYFDSDAPAPGIGFCSAWQDSHWANLVIRLNLSGGKTMHVEPGDVIEVDATVDLTPSQPTYALCATLQQQQGESVETITVLNGFLEQDVERGSKWEFRE